MQHVTEEQAEANRQVPPRSIWVALPDPAGNHHHDASHITVMDPDAAGHASDR